MAFTGQIGTADSYLANIELASPGGQSATLRNIQAKANIQNTTVRTVQAKAHIGLIQTVVQTVQAKARILITLKSRLEVDYNIFPVIQLRCCVSYNVGNQVVSSRTVQAKASIVRALTTRLAFRFEIDYQMPSGYVHRPTQRTQFRTVRTCVAKARIQARS